MNVIVFAEIVKLSLQLALEVVKSIPEDQRGAFWERHNKRMEWLEGLFGRKEGT